MITYIMIHNFSNLSTETFDHALQSCMILIDLCLYFSETFDAKVGRPQGRCRSNHRPDQVREIIMLSSNRPVSSLLPQKIWPHFIEKLLW